ncbi:hypothetical protein C731_0888 [Mycolicibacterium hassiacum DSM 44199]|uniref:Secreted protein n=1 Tax=Mycolicibacterium hassiacum (strain DSM 44199 / CIP 105218 / JCM 12690 / 3849) TaxID=1122247 RepID=K5BCE6_MYCHD|nr:hypothetical protein C731_0888 [Mycolicibacterium hassiacum DSM 44199]
MKPTVPAASLRSWCVAGSGSSALAVLPVAWGQAAGEALQRFPEDTTKWCCTIAGGSPCATPPARY